MRGNGLKVSMGVTSVPLNGQLIIPAARSMKDFEFLLSSALKNIILLDVHIAQLPYIRRMAEQSGKNLILHADLVQGLRSDEAGAQFLCQVIKPAGIISTHSNVISTVKKHHIISIQRIFLLDSHSLETSYRIMRTSDPDYIEVLPGMMPQIIQEIALKSKRPILAGGFIRSLSDVELILDSGAMAVTTSSRSLWSKQVQRL